MRKGKAHPPVNNSLHESFNVDYLSFFLYIPGRLFQDFIKKVHTMIELSRNNFMPPVILTEF